MECFAKLKQVKFFNDLKVFKIVRIWKFNSLKGKKDKAVNELKSNMFQSDKNLRKCLEQHSRLCHNISQIKLIQLD